MDLYQILSIETLQLMESIPKNKFDNANLRLLKHHAFASNFEHWNFASNENLFPILFLTIQLLCFPCDFSKIKDTILKGCPHCVICLIVINTPKFDSKPMMDQTFIGNIHVHNYSYRFPFGLH